MIALHFLLLRLVVIRLGHENAKNGFLSICNYVCVSPDLACMHIR